MDGKIYVQVQDRSFKGEDAAEFLRHLMRHIKGKILVVWDGCPIHKSKEIKKLLSGDDEARIHLEALPPYCPDLNPDEGVWQYLKCVMLKNICFPDLKKLEKKLRKGIRILRRNSDVIISNFRKIGYV